MARNVLITGANSGFGLLTARKFAQAGDTVHAGYRNPAKLAGLQALIDAGLPIHPVQLDVTDPGQIAAAVAQASRTAPIDVLVNNAGFEVTGPIDEVSDASYQRQFDTNVLGVIRMIRAVSPSMRERRTGVIVNLSSIVGWLSVPYVALYAASKHAVEALSEALWFELRPFGIRVAIVEPGAFNTSFGDNVVVDPGFNQASPHWANAERFNGATRALLEAGSQGQDPQEVADAVYDAVTTAEPRLRWVAGNDARGFIPMYKSQEFEDYSSGMLGVLGLSDWGAPPTALQMSAQASE